MAQVQRQTLALTRNDWTRIKDALEAAARLEKEDGDQDAADDCIAIAGRIREMKIMRDPPPAPRKVRR